MLELSAPIQLNANTMYFLDTKMHMVTFLITMFEVVMLVFQAIYFLQRPKDNSRLQFLLLLLFLIAYNICSGLFPDPRWVLPVPVQTILAYFVGFAMSMYVVYYFYKVFDLKHLRFFATYGLLFFLFFPFVFMFVLPYLLTGDSRLSAQLTVIVPFCYGLGFIYNTARALRLKFHPAEGERRATDHALYEHALAAYLSTLCWAALPVIVFFGDFQVLEHSVTNAGFLMMTLIYVKSSIRQSRYEYDKLLESERSQRELARSLKKKVQKRTRRIERILEAKKTTFVNLAHETKTPLTLINNYLTDYIEKNGETEELRIVRSNLRRLTNDIVNFFDIESYEKGFSMYNHDRTSNFSSLLKDKVFLFTAAAAKKRILLESSISDDILVRAHPGALDRIVNNLIDNAIKYSEADTIIQTGLYRTGTQITFYVKDSGCGIPAHLQEKVFEPYYKLSVQGRNTDGMGMGLSIVNRIVTDINGSIELTSEAGQGTTICISLPEAKGCDGSVPGVTPAIEVTHSLSLNAHRDASVKMDMPYIMVVEDNIEMRAFLKSKLAVLYNVVEAGNGKEAIERLTCLACLDLIVSDVMMEDMSGYELCQAVLSMERYAHIPFIFLSARSSVEERVKGLNLGAVAYIQKPFSSEELLAKVESILKNLKLQRNAVVNKAYHVMLADTHRVDPIAVRTESVFDTNCEKYQLTKREVEIAKLLLTGTPYKIISDELGISEKTASKHISNIYSKAGVKNKVELLNKLQAHV